jgi:hypothetical protein
MNEQQEYLLKPELLVDDPPLPLFSHERDHRQRIHTLHLCVLYVVNALLLSGLIFLSVSRGNCVDPSLKTYSKWL